MTPVAGMRTPLLCLLCLAPAVAAPVPKPTPAKTLDAEALEGKWVIVTRDSGGGHSPQVNDGGTFTVEFKDGQVSAGTDGQKWFTDRPFPPTRRRPPSGSTSR